MRNTCKFTSEDYHSCKLSKLDDDDISRHPKQLKKGDEEDKDWISRLPDAILGDILSYLPTKEAVATSVLSSRWMDVFTCVTSLDFDDSPICHCEHRPHKKYFFFLFKMFVDKVLYLCHTNHVANYRLHFGKGENHPTHPGCSKEACFPELEPMRLHAWMCFPLTRGVTKLDIRAYVSKPCNLPSAIFSCQTLEVLKLNIINIHFEPPLSFSLPNLKEFHLVMRVLPGADFATRLVSSCPLLEHLGLYGHLDSVYPIHISSTSLRRLVIEACYPVVDGRTNVVLDVPNLEYLRYLDSLALNYSIGELNALVEAQFEIQHNAFAEAIVSLSKSMSNARHLWIMSDCIKALDSTQSKLEFPVFRNLRHLRLGCDDYHHWNKLLMELLDSAPILETLSFEWGIVPGEDECDPYYEVTFKQECESWSQTHKIPSCLMFHLKRITIYRYIYSDWELEIVKYFLRSSMVLEELHIVSDTQTTPTEKILLDDLLPKLSRASKTCQFKVSIDK